MDVKLFIDGEEIDLSEFVVKILSGAIVGAVTSLRGIKRNWKEIARAIEEFKRSKLMKETLGEHVFSKYLETKTAEWNEFQKSVTDWELNKYRDL